MKLLLSHTALMKLIMRGLLSCADLNTMVVVEILKRLKHRIAFVSIECISWKGRQFVNLMARLHELWQFYPGYFWVHLRSPIGL